MTALYLIIDTSTRFGGVALWADGMLVRSQSWYSRNNHTSELMPAVEGIAKGHGIRPVDLAGIAVAHGPGGFSALRAGLGVAKGLAFAANLPVVGVSTLEASAYPYRECGLPVCAMIEAGKGAVAWARFQEADGWRRRTPDRVTPLEAALSARGRRMVFCGEGAPQNAEAILKAFGAKAHIIEEPAPLSRLAGVAEIGVALLEAGSAEPVASLHPRYLRSPGITEPSPPKAVRRGG